MPSTMVIGRVGRLLQTLVCKKVPHAHSTKYFPQRDLQLPPPHPTPRAFCQPFPNSSPTHALVQWDDQDYCTHTFSVLFCLARVPPCFQL